MKKILCIILSFIMLLTIVSPVIAADDVLIYKWLRYKTEDNEITITGYVADYDFSAENEYDLDEEPVIPDEIGGKPVTAIADFAFEGAPYKYIYGNKNITSIGKGAFYKCDSLKRIDRFAHFTSSGNVESGSNLLYDENGVMAAGTGTEIRPDRTYAEPNIKAVASYAFAGKYSEVMNLPNVTSVDEKAFMDAHIESLSLSSLTDIGVSAFEGAYLKEAYFQDVEKVGERAFANAKGEIYMYGNAPEFAENAFEGCDDSLTVYYDKNAQGWDELHFENVKFEGIEPEVFHVKFIQNFEDTGLAGDFFADISVYKGTSLTDRNMPEIPAVEGYLPGEVKGQWKQAFENAVIEVVYNNILYFTVTFIDGVTDEVIATQQVKRYDDVTDFPTPPEHEGYEFSFWDGDPQYVFGDRNIYARYQILFYEVKLIDSLAPDTPLGILTVYYGHDVEFPEPPKHTGYNFKGWDKDGKNIKADTTITALYEKAVYTVKFVDSLTNEVISEAAITYGENVTEFPAPPVHEGYEFTRWNHDGKNISEDTEIRALYSKITVIKGDLNGDGKVNTADAVYVLKFSASMIEFDEKQMQAGDCNHDDTVNTADAVLILKYAAGMIHEF